MQVVKRQQIVNCVWNSADAQHLFSPTKHYVCPLLLLEPHSPPVPETLAILGVYHSYYASKIIVFADAYQEDLNLLAIYSIECYLDIVSNVLGNPALLFQSYLPLGRIWLYCCHLRVLNRESVCGKLRGFFLLTFLRK